MYFIFPIECHQRKNLIILHIHQHINKYVSIQNVLYKVTDKSNHGLIHLLNKITLCEYFIDGETIGAIPYAVL